MAFLNALIVADQFHYFLGNSYIKIKRKYDYLTLKLLKFNKNICNVVIIVEEAFEFCWSSFAEENYTSPKSTTRDAKLNKFAKNPMTTGFIMLTLIYVISMQFLLLSGRHSSAQKVLSGVEQGEMAVFAGY